MGNIAKLFFLLASTAHAWDNYSEYRDFLALNEKLEATNYPLMVCREEHEQYLSPAWTEFHDFSVAALDRGLTPNLVLNKKFYQQVTLLEIATRFALEKDDWALLDKMVEKHADFNFMVGDKLVRESILIKTEFKNQNPLALKVLQFLLDHGANPQPMRGNQMHCVHFFALFCNSPPALEAILNKMRELKINTNVKDADGRTPILAFMEDVDEPINEESIDIPRKLDILLANGADLSIKDSNNRDVFTIVDNLDFGLKQVIFRQWLKERFYKE